jgi:hypothetical protein
MMKLKIFSTHYSGSVFIGVNTMQKPGSPEN